jgi:hypothetical protein
MTRHLSFLVHLVLSELAHLVLPELAHLGGGGFPPFCLQVHVCLTRRRIHVCLVLPEVTGMNPVSEREGGVREGLTTSILF